MDKEYPQQLVIGCINTNCSNEINLLLNNKYFKDRAYVGYCSRCGINIRIEKFSPFVNDLIAVMETNIPSIRIPIKRAGKFIKSDIQ